MLSMLQGVRQMIGWSDDWQRGGRVLHVDGDRGLTGGVVLGQEVVVDVDVAHFARLKSSGLVGRVTVWEEPLKRLACSRSAGS